MKTVATGFSGIGGGDLAARNAGFETIWQAEFDPTPHGKHMRPTPMHRQWPVRILNRHFPEVHNYGDIASVRRPPAPDVFVFGSPCQDLSVAGQRKGLTGARSGLFFEAARVISECRPSLAIWENVPGAFSSNTGRDFLAVLSAMAELGARDIAWRVLDSQYAGVPQQRRRVYLVADFVGERAGEILFESGRCEGHPTAGRATGKDLAKPLGASATSYGGQRFDLDNETYVASSVAREVSAQPNASHRDDDDTYVPVVGHQVQTKHRSDFESETLIALEVALLYDPTQITSAAIRSTGRSYTLPAEAHAPLMVRTAQTGANGKGISEDMAYTLDGTNGQALSLPVGVRRLTPIECERLQGFPDGWTCLCGAEADLFACGCPDGPRYKGCGNAMTVNVIQWVLRRIREVL